MSESTYRIESAKQGRAGCQNKACKDQAIKIGKGELRFGVLVSFNEHTSWKWKHWGCVTPRQIENIVEQLGGLDGLDLDKDLDILDGYEELPPEYQEKVKYTLENGHVNDEDWKGDPELNRPGKKGINKRAPKKKAGNGDTGDTAAAESPVKPKKGAKKKSAAAEDQDEASSKKKASRKRKIAEEDDEVDEAPPKKRASGAKSKKAAIKDEHLDDEEPAFEEAPKKRGRGRKVKPEPEVDDAEAALPQAADAAQLETTKAAKQVHAKKRARRSAVKKEESETEEGHVPQPAARSNRSKKVKTEATDDEDVLDDVDKKQQANKPRGKKVAPVPVPQDEQTDDPQPEESETAIKEDADGDGSVGARPAKPGKRRSRDSRGSRTSRNKV